MMAGSHHSVVFLAKRAVDSEPMSRPQPYR
jgi:hypothetical protein